MWSPCGVVYAHHHILLIVCICQHSFMSSCNTFMSQLLNFVSVLITFMSPLYAFMSKGRHCSAVSEHRHTCLLNMILMQVNGVPVNTTACGDLTKSLCEGDPKLLNVVERMAGGKTLWTAGPRPPHRHAQARGVPGCSFTGCAWAAT